MPERELDSLGEMLLAAGASSRFVRRIVAELEDHLADLRDEGRSMGCTEAEIDAYAWSAIGDVREIARQCLRDERARAWVYRYPRIARIVLPVAFVAVLPAAPLYAGIAHAGLIARWSAALMLGAGVTVCMLLGMQLVILFS